MEEIEFIYSEGICKIFHNGELKYQLRVPRSVLLEWRKILLDRGYSVQSESDSRNNYYVKYVKS
jgi:hypothetical protein